MFAFRLSRAMATGSVIPLARPPACPDCGARMRYLANGRTKAPSETHYVLLSVSVAGLLAKQLLCHPKRPKARSAPVGLSAVPARVQQRKPLTTQHHTLAPAAKGPKAKRSRR